MKLLISATGKEMSAGSGSFRLLVLVLPVAALIAFPGGLRAQRPGPADSVEKNIAVMVDVSLSVDADNSYAARSLIEGIVNARFGAESRALWQFQSTATGNPGELLNLEAIVAGNPSAQPLWSAGRKMIVTSFGNREASRDNPKAAALIDLNRPDDVDRALDTLFGRSSAYFRGKLMHTRTFLNLAKAAIADRLLNSDAIERSFYLFVVSDGMEDVSGQAANASAEVLAAANANWIAQVGYTKDESDLINTWESGVFFSQNELGRFKYRNPIAGRKQPVDVIVYSTIYIPPPPVRSLAFFDPAPEAREPKVIDGNDSWVQWHLESEDPGDTEMTFQLEFKPQDPNGKPLTIRGLKKRGLELLKEDPGIKELPLQLPNGRYELVVTTEEETPLKSYAGTEKKSPVVINLSVSKPSIAFRPPLLETVEIGKNGAKTFSPHRFNTVAEVKFEWEALDSSGEKPRRAGDPPGGYRLQIRSIKSGQPDDIVAEAEGLKDRTADLNSMAFSSRELLSGEFQITVRGEWPGQKPEEAVAAFRIPAVDLVPSRSGERGADSKNRTTRCVIRFTNAHAGHPYSGYRYEVTDAKGARVEGGEISRKDKEKLDLCHLENGDYDVKVEFVYDPPGGNEMIGDDFMAYLTIKKSNLFLYIFTGMACVTLGLFLTYFWLRGRR